MTPVNWPLKEQKRLDILNGMRTTVCCLVIRGQQAAAAYVGASRVYLFRRNKVLAMSEDHSIPMYLVKAGDISIDEIRHHPARNKLLRVMGSEEESVNSQFLRLPKLRGGEHFLLCSDGFWEWIRENEMLRTLAEADNAAAWLEKMREIVWERGNGSGMDNLSAIAVAVPESGRTGLVSLFRKRKQ